MKQVANRSVFQELFLREVKIRFLVLRRMIRTKESEDVTIL